MIKNTLIALTIGLIFQSCGFFFYNYRGYIDSNFSIPNNQADTNIRYQVGQLIYRQSFKSEFYQRFAAKTFDTLFFYGPDYHSLKFKITENQLTTNVHFVYFGYNGWRKHPPNKLFITAFRDSLKTQFRATEVINKDISNEKKKRNNK
jgi:hypothetical protein